MVQLYYKAKLFLRITARIGAAVDTKVFLEVKNKNLLLIYCIWYKPRTETKMVESKKCFLSGASNIDESTKGISARNVYEIAYFC